MTRLLVSLGVAGLCGAALVSLKLTGAIDCSWWWATCPLWGSPPVAGAVALAAAYAAMLRPIEEEWE